jgi:hypothetical protein
MLYNKMVALGLMVSLDDWLGKWRKHGQHLRKRRHQRAN